MASKQHVHYTEQDSEAGLQENMGDEFLESIFTLEESQKLELCKSAPTVEVLVQIEGVEFRTMAAMRIYARYFPVIFFAFFMLASISVDFSRLYKVSQLEEMTLRVHQNSFFRLK